MGDTISFMLKSATGQILPAMASTLKKGRAYAIDKGVEESVLLSARLFPDMMPLLNQYQMAAETPARAAARIAGLEMPSLRIPSLLSMNCWSAWKSAINLSRP